MGGLFVFLGTGASAGVPIIGCKCPVCTSSSPYNHRLRPAGWIQVHGKSFLIDVGPDFRQQALKHQIERVDGLILTHPHFDHVAGIDDLRIYYVRQNKPVPCLLSEESLKEIKIRYHYFFQQPGKNLTARLTYQVLEYDRGEVEFVGLNIGYFSYVQGDMKVNGYRIGDFAYVSDIRNYDESVFESLEGVKNLVLSALSKESSNFHLSLDEAVSFARRVGANRTWLTHLSHFLDHEEANRELPPDIQLGYDGLQIEFGV